MDIYSFMARMLFFLPDKHRKMIRYYGIYSHNIEDKLQEIDNKTWAKAIQNSFTKNPGKCPDCKAMMMTETIYSYFADREIKTIVKTHTIIRGYFKPNIKGKKRLQPP